MTGKLRVFVSSVQNELEDERLIVQNLLNTDSFLLQHCAPVLYELEPASPEKALEGCIAAVDECQVYLLIIGQQYGTPVGEISITHAEYRRAKERELPLLVFIRGGRSVKRELGTETLLKEIDSDGPKYKRFGNVVELQKEVRAALVKLLKERFGRTPSSDENEIAEQTIEATSTFESQSMKRLTWEQLDHSVALRLVAAAEGLDAETIDDDALLQSALLRGFVWHDVDSGEHYATAAGIILLARDPSAVFPQCRVLADAYRSTEADGEPRDHEDIRGPMPEVIERAIRFVDRNTRHPMRVAGLNRLRLDEYPTEPLREALVNAVAHRQYEDAGRKILLEVYADRVVVFSPGLPPKPITVERLRKGKYKPCSRNPVLAHSLSYFHRIEERGSGFRRMRSGMLGHGLDAPLLGTDTGYFSVTFPGPGEDMERITVPESRLVVTPAIEAQLTERQKKMAAALASGEELTSRRCQQEFEVTRETVSKDFAVLVDLGLAVKQGEGRSTRYVSSREAEP